jgi:hypothetical protein
MQHGEDEDNGGVVSNIERLQDNLDLMYTKEESSDDCLQLDSSSPIPGDGNGMNPAAGFINMLMCVNVAGFILCTAGESVLLPDDSFTMDHVQQHVGESILPHNFEKLRTTRRAFQKMEAEGTAKFMRSLSGLKWKETGSDKPSGTEIKNESLAAALQKKVEFKKEEWEDFQVADLSSDSYIKAGNCYFTPADTRPSVYGFTEIHVKNPKKWKAELEVLAPHYKARGGRLAKKDRLGPVYEIGFLATGLGASTRHTPSGSATKEEGEGKKTQALMHDHFTFSEDRFVKNQKRLYNNNKSAEEAAPPATGAPLSLATPAVAGAPPAATDAAGAAALPTVKQRQKRPRLSFEPDPPPPPALSAEALESFLTCPDGYALADEPNLFFSVGSTLPAGGGAGGDGGGD